ncbi:unnamed protein product [Lactuca virosa]|uniref:Uncharacterized protein n=1 Tax=Lactuca virosa TaxID=75947 RepID=A0AAU9MEE9_9ASTR|nr:unnamed protein product [Lactuca virosa]
MPKQVWRADITCGHNAYHSITKFISSSASSSSGINTLARSKEDYSKEFEEKKSELQAKVIVFFFNRKSGQTVAIIILHNYFFLKIATAHVKVVTASFLPDSNL